MTPRPLEITDILRAAADLIEPEGSWTRGVYARAEDGQQVDPQSRRATCWCGVGAIIRAGGWDAVYGADRFLRVAARYRSLDGFPDWQDRKGRTQAEVVAALRKAADLQCKAEADAVPRSGGTKT